MDKQPRIVVIGSGAAGLGAATKLKELGFTDITLVDAGQAAGGRIAKANIGKAWVDTGAQYIHGASEKNPVYCFFKKCGFLSEVPEEGKRVFYSSNGHQIDEDFGEQVYEAGERIIRFYASNTEKSIGEHFAENGQSVLKTWGDDVKKVAQSVLALVGKEMLLDIGASDLHKVSLASWQYYINMGEDLNVQGFMFQILEKLVEEIPKERLLLNKVVSKIEWDGSFPGKDDLVYPVKVMCEDGDEIMADHVIVTISLGCLKAHASTLFNPSLSAEKMEVIDKLGFGNISKIFLEYEEAFWESDVSLLSFVWDDVSFASVCTNQSEWLKDLQLFTVMTPKEKFGNVLIGWCPGDTADLIETIPEKQLSSAITEHIRMFTGNPNIPPPKTVVSTQWHSNKFIRGSVTFLPVGQDGKIMDVLAQPLEGTKKVTAVSLQQDQDLQVLFAGEATIKSSYGTVQGALMSGQREAEKLARHYNRPVPSLTVPCETST